MFGMEDKASVVKKGVTKSVDWPYIVVLRCL
jgi:hypothetical protein